jgi:hypothetical protein
MGVNVGTAPVSAFLAILVALVLIIGFVVARRRGHLRSRGALFAAAIVVALLIIFAMTGGFVPKP